MLKKFETNANDILDGNYELEYYAAPLLGELTLDGWKFSKCKGNVSGGFTYANGCVSVGLLKSLENPTKGKAKFIYEANTYSYVPETTISESSHAEELTDFDDNELNWDVVNDMVVHTTFSSTVKKYAFTISGTQAMPVTIFRDTSQIDQHPWHLKILRKEGDNYVQAGGFGTAFLADGQTLPGEYYFDASPGEYYFELTKVSGGSVPNFNASFNLFYKARNFNSYKYLFGGGVRVKSIEYFANQNNISDKIMNYTYHDLSDSKKSSGALVFTKPVLSYSALYKAKLQWACVYMCVLHPCCTDDFITNITYSSNKNFLPVQKTKGGDIGYQFVSVYETNKGKTIYQYTSPIDYPNLYTPATLPPFYTVPNYDFQRGNLKNKKIYNNTGDLLSENKFYYTPSSANNKTGAKINFVFHSEVGEFLYAGTFNSYSEFTAANYGVANLLGPDTSAILSMYVHQELSGITNLIKEEQIEYFPDQNPITTTTSYTYNSRDYLLEKKTTFPTGETNLTNSKYAHEKANAFLISKNIISIPLETTITKKTDSLDLGKILSKVETRYPISQTEADTKTSGLALPYEVWSKDLQSTNLSKEITYDKYDTLGNLQQYTPRGGVPTTIIWGYNKTQPIAKIEGATYSQVQQFTAGIIAASNDDNLQGTPASEQSLSNALDAFRKEPALYSFQITAYTYDPLIGVRSITPPSGIRESYFYDSANRLEKIVDLNGNILKEFKYNYKQ